MYKPEARMRTLVPRAEGVDAWALARVLVARWRAGSRDILPAEFLNTGPEATEKA